MADLVTKWLYDHEIAFWIEGGLIFDTYVCAVKLDLERLQNRIMDELQQLDMRPKGATFDDSAKLLIHFDTGTSTTPMRKFLFDLAVSSLRRSPKPFSSLGDGILRQLLEHQDLMTALLLEIEKDTDDMDDISWAGGKRYHRHSRGDGCQCTNAKKPRAEIKSLPPTALDESEVDEHEAFEDDGSTSDDSQVIPCPRYIMELLTNSWQQ